MTSENDNDPLDGADVGETVTVEETVRLNEINYIPCVYYGGDRFSDPRLKDAQIVTGPPGDGDRIVLTWEGNVTKRLPARWDYHADPITEKEKRAHRRKKWGKRVAKVGAIAIPVLLATWLSLHLTEKLATKMVVNGKEVTAPVAPDVLGVLAIVVAMTVIISWGINGRLPRRV